MPVNYYTCDNCGFIFTRVSECIQCPDCGKKTIRKATEAEVKEFLSRSKEVWDETTEQWISK